MELSEIRKQINKIDVALKPLLQQRMECAEMVAQSKAASAKEQKITPVIYVEQRENEILAAVDCGEQTEAVRRLLIEIMGTSRRQQYRLLVEQGALCDIYGAYLPGALCKLQLCLGKLTAAMHVLSRYNVTLLEADASSITIVAMEELEMQTLRTQLVMEQMIERI